MKLFLFLFLSICAFYDVKEKQLSAVFLIGVFVAIAAGELFIGQKAVTELMLDIIIGGVFLGIALVSKQAVGYADGVVLCCSGLILGVYANLNLLFYSLIAISICSIVMLLLRKATVKDRIPFLPFMLVGYLGVLVL